MRYPVSLWTVLRVQSFFDAKGPLIQELLFFRLKIDKDKIVKS